MSTWPMKPRLISCFATVHTVQFLPSAKCYGLDIIVDDSIQAQSDIYMEAGDHETLLHMGHAQFARLTANAEHGRFSAHD
jgi:prolyl-tRNA editing enzyme YbaK/EbsC (Cys-tRNA(Pro) deacylase)